MTKQKPRCAIYCRTSTSSQRDDKTIESQKAELPLYAKSQGWEVYDTYVDDGKSSGFIKGRADFQRLLADMEAKKFGILLVTEHSRVTGSEDPEELARITGPMMRNGIQLASPQEGCLSQDNFMGRFMTQVKFMFGAERKAEIGRAMKRGKLQKLRQGIYCLPHVPYGLKRITDRTQKPAKHTILINESEAETLRMCYDLIVNQARSLNWVADYLNTIGTKPKIAKKWNPGLLQAVLRNKDSLTGHIVCNKSPSRMIGDGKFEKLPENPESEWIHCPVPAVFSKAEYETLDSHIRANRKQGRPMISESGFLLGHQKVKCGECGRVAGPRWTAPRVGKVTKYYACGSRVMQPKFMKEGERRCDLPYVNQEGLDTMVWQKLVIDLFMFPERTLKNWSKVTNMKAGAFKVLQARLEKTLKDIKGKEQQIENLLDAGIGGQFPPEMVKSKKAVLDKNMTVLNDERANLEKEVRKARTVETNKEALNSAVKDLGKLGNRLSSKMNEMPMADRQRLIGYYMPNGAFIEIHHLHPDDYHTVDLGPRRKITIKWDWSLKGIFDLKALLGALKAYDKTGKVPEYDAYINGESIR